jgi:Zn-dependent protease
MISPTVADWIARMAIMIPVFLVAFTVHEFSHALTATLLGDSTPRRDGRLTLNPMAHIDFLGFFCLLVFHFGWAKPVEFDPRNFKSPKTYSILTAIAGPLSNFVLALTSMYLLKLFPIHSISLAANKTFIQIIQTSVWVNIMWGVFNFLPIPPLDGGHLLMSFLRERAPEAAMWLQQYSFLILIALLLLPFPGVQFLGKLNEIVHSYLANLVIV